MTTLIRIEVEKIVRRRLNQIVLGVFLSLLIVVYVLLWLATDVISEAGGGEVGDLRSALFLEETVPFAILLIYSFGFAAGVVVIGASIGSEYAWNTVRTLTSVEPRRSRLLTAKLIALWGTIVVGLILGLVVSVATSSLITIADGQIDLSFVDLSYVRDSAYAFLRMLVGTAPYFGLALMFGVVGRSATAGIALALGVGFLEGIVSGLMQLAGGWLGELPKYMLDRNTDSLAFTRGGPFDAIAGQGTALGDLFEQPSVWHSVWVLSAWTTLFVLTAFWTFRRQDLEYQG